MEKRTKFILIGLGVVALGAGGYFIYQKIKKDSDLKSTDDFKDAVNENDLPELDIPKTSTPTRVVVKSSDSGFPLKLKSKGQLVKDVQNALIKKYGASILPKFGADGYYGDELFTALISKSLPTWIDSPAYVKILAINSSTDKPKTDSTPKEEEWSSTRISNYLHKAIQNDNVFYALDALKKIKNVAKYKTTNTEFKKKDIDGVSKTIVNALSEKFTSSDYKKKINAHFYRIGLKYNGSQWSLSGIDKQLVTTIQTTIWDAVGKKLNVPKRTLLGYFLSQKGDVVQFLTHDNKQLFVQSNTIQFL